MTKIVAIGVGSIVFGVELLRDIYQTPELRGAELWLVDLSPRAGARMGALAARLNEASGWDVSLHVTTDRLQALPAADFVVTSIAVARDETWKTDHRLALKHGFPSVLSENGGPGGLSHTLRSVPPMVAIAKDVERLAPDALMLNYTNPENRVCLGIHRYTSVRCIGLCHGVAETIQMAAEVLEMPRDEIDLRAAGTNHFVWTISLTERSTGHDLLPRLRERLSVADPAKWSLCTWLFDHFGSFPTTGDDHVGEYISYAAEFLGTKGYDFEGMSRSRTLGGANVDAWGGGDEVRRALAHEAIARIAPRPRRHPDHRRAHRPQDRPAAVVHHPEPRVRREPAG